MSSPPWTYQGPLFSFNTTTVAPNHYNYMQAFFGVAVVPTTRNADLAVYPSIETTTGSTVFRTVMVHHYGDPIHAWYLRDEWFDKVTHTIMAVSAETAVAPLAGAWGVISFQAAGAHNG